MVTVIDRDRFNHDAEDARIVIETDWGHDGRVVERQMLKLFVVVGNVTALAGEMRIDHFSSIKLSWSLNERGKGGGRLKIMEDKEFGGLEDVKEFSW